MSKSASLPTTATNKASPTGFLDLSAELRNKIYDYALITREPIIIHLRKTKQSRWKWVTTANAECNTNLLKTCKTVHNEATPVFIGNNIFSIMVKDIPLALSTLPRINKIRYLRLNDLVPFTILDFHTALVALRNCAQTLHKDIQMLSFPDAVLHSVYWPEYMARQLLPLMRRFCKSRSYEEVANIVDFHLDMDNEYYSVQGAKEYTVNVRLEIRKLLAAEEKSRNEKNDVIDLTGED